MTYFSKNFVATVDQFHRAILDFNGNDFQTGFDALCEYLIDSDFITIKGLDALVTAKFSRGYIRTKPNTFDDFIELAGLFNFVDDDFDSLFFDIFGEENVDWVDAEYIND